MLKMESVRCILCDVDEADFFLEDEGCKSVKCKRCGLVYVNPRPKFSELKAKYSNGSLIKEDEYFVSIDERLLKAKLDLQLIKKVKQCGRILEIGCAEGSFLAEAIKLGYEPYGIEINKKFVEYARSKYRLSNVSECDLLESSLPDGYFDIIYMRNVLCHLHDPLRELDKINKLLKENGVFICVTGNLGGLSIRQIKRYSNFISPHLAQHLFHYSERNLFYLFRKTNFHIEKIHKFSAYIDECNGLFFRIINCILTKELSIKVLAFIRVLLGKLCLKKGRLLSLIIIASKNKPEDMVSL